VRTILISTSAMLLLTAAMIRAGDPPPVKEGQIVASTVASAPARTPRRHKPEFESRSPAGCGIRTGIPRKDRLAVSPGEAGPANRCLPSIHRLDCHQDTHLQRDLDHADSHNARLSPAGSGTAAPFHWTRTMPRGPSNSMRYSAVGAGCGAISSMNAAGAGAGFRATGPPSPAASAQLLELVVFQMQKLGRPANAMRSRQLCVSSPQPFWKRRFPQACPPPMFQTPILSLHLHRYGSTCLSHGQSSLEPRKTDLISYGLGRLIHPCRKVTEPCGSADPSSLRRPTRRGVGSAGAAILRPLAVPRGHVPKG